MKLLKKLTAIIILLSMLITLNSPIISYAIDQETDGEKIEIDPEIKENEEWDISKMRDGSIIAKWTLEDRTITISGSGEMTNWNYSSMDDWYSSKFTHIIYTSFAKNVKIEGNVTNIGENAFLECSSIENIVIPNSIERIEYSAFSGCKSLTNITIPNSVTSIAMSAFAGCSSLKSFSVEANNQNYSSVDGVLYDKDKTVLMCYPKGKKNANFIVPDSVKNIESSAFTGCSSLTNIDIPNSVTSIRARTFEGCSSLERIQIPSSVTSIEANAFKGCSNLKNIVIPNSVTSIRDSIFEGCSSLESIQIPNSVTSIASNAFKRCSSLEIIQMPSSITSIASNTFEGCSSLKNIEIPNRVTSIRYSAFEGCSSLERIQIPSSVTSIASNAFKGCSSLKNIEIPNSVTSIESSTFEGCSSLEGIQIPNSVTSIASNVFKGCSSLTNIEIPNSLMSIGNSAFYGCENLTNITIPNSVTSIGKSAFDNLKMIIKCNANSKVHEYCEDNEISYILLDDKTSNITTEYEIKEEEIWDISKNGDGSVIVKWTLEDKTITVFGSGDIKEWPINSEVNWYNNKYKKIIEKVKIENGVKRIESSAFSGCSRLTSIEIPNSVTRIGSSAFKGCSSLTRIEIPNSVTSIENMAFYGCSSLTEIKVNNQYYIGIDGVLYSRDLTKLIKYPAKKNNREFNIPNSVTCIEEYAFEGCSNLTSIDIPNSVTSIEACAFEGSSSLISINIPNSVKSIEHGTFSRCSSLKNITIPNSVTSISYGSFSECSSMEKIEIPNSVKIIEYGTFSECTNLSSITIPNSVTSIEAHVFEECSSLTTINIPNGVTSIEDDVFKGCSSLISIGIPNSVTSIGGGAFSECSSLTSIDIPNSVTKIEFGAFKKCRSLRSINIPNSVKNIYGSTFSECKSLTNITIPNSVTSIGEGVFYNCSSLTNITIPASITTIEMGTFRRCSGLKKITIPNSVTSIRSNAFEECSSLENIVIYNSTTSVESGAFYNCKGPIICKRNSGAHRYAKSGNIRYVIDESMPKVTYTPSEFEKAQKQAVVKIDVTDIAGVEENNIKYLWSTKEEVTKAEVNNALTNGQEISSPTGKTGTYYIYVYAKDKFGNEGIAKSSPIKLDNTSPTIELAENKYYQKPNIQDENLETVVLTKDGNKVETYKYGETIFGEGTYELIATDEAGNSTTKEFVLQKIPTGEEGLNYEITPSELTNQDVTLNVSKKDATNTELEIELSTDGKNYEVGNTKTITENGKVYARLEKEGAYGEAIEIEITNIDKKAPVIEGVKDKRTYANKATPKAVDENLESVKLEKEGQEVVGYENGTTITELGTYKITAIDKVGNKTEVEFYIKDIPSTEEVVEYTVSPEGLTNQDVKVSVTKKENEEYQDLIVQMSTDGENYEAVTEKTITENGTVYIRIVKEEEGNTIEGEVIEVEIKNIDKTAPEAQVAYSNKELTKENVTATITTNEEIQEIEGWTRGEDRKQLTKEYSENKTEEITITDLAGNSTKVTIEITNIDKTAPEGQVTYSETNPTNKNVIATITANEEIQEVEGWTISQDKKKLTKEYNENKTEKVIIKDKIGNEKEVDVKVLNIDRTKPEVRVTYSTKSKTNKNVTVTITVNEEIQGITGWTLSSDKKKLTKEYSANKTETITIKDLAGNTSNVAIEITNIDKTAPTANVEYSTTNLTNQNVTVIITANEEIQGITGWTLSNDKKTLTKTYQSNVEETIQVKDLAGNTIDKNISIKNIDKTKPEIAGVENANSYNDSVIITATDTNPGTLLLEKDGEKVEGYTNGKEIIEEGTYKLTAVDKLGNTTIVNFTIKYVRGDLNKDSKIDMLDVLTILKHISQEKKTSVANKHPEWKLSEKGKIVSDTDKNGKVEMLDVLKILQYIAAKTKERTAQKHPEWLNLN